MVCFRSVRSAAQVLIDTPRARKRSRIAAGGLLCAWVLLLPASAAEGQAFSYPSMQLPSVATRDYTGAIVGGAGTTAVFQWREGWTADRYTQLDLGIADRKGSDGLMVFAGGSVGQLLTSATPDQPLDMLVTVGGGVAFGSGVSLVRIPVGLSLGHTFELDQGMSLTPYLHPRVSLDSCSSCGTNRRSKTELSLNFDVGVSYQVSREFALRVAASFSGSDLVGSDDTFGIGLNWTPAPLIRPRP